jgi:hypothetical protein
MADKVQKLKNKKIDGLSRVEKKQDDNSFFSEIDQKKNPFVLYWSITVIILIAVLFLAVFLATTVKRQNLNFNDSLNSNSEYTDSSYSDRLSKITSIGVASIRFNQGEFEAVSGVKNSDFPLENSKFIFSENKIILTGKIRDSWLPINTRLIVVTTVQDGKFVFALAPDSWENILVYGEKQKKIEQILTDNINQVLAKENMIAKSVTVSNGEIEFKIIKE